MIVDDEPIVRLGLSTLIEWERHGFALAGTAADGVEAWKRIETEAVDIVVTDILMPRMDGLELVRKLKESSTDVAVVVLSCLDDFVYVKEAMKLGARDYILKPTMEPEELLAILLEAKEALARQRQEQAQVARWREELQQSKQAQLGLKLEKWLISGLPDEELAEQLLPPGKWLHSMGVHAAEGQPAYTDWSDLGVHAAVRCGEQSVLLLYAAEPLVSQHEWNVMCYERAAWLERYIIREIGLEESAFVIGIGMKVRSLPDVAAAARLLESQVNRSFYEGASSRIIPLPDTTAVAHSIRLPQEEKVDLLRAVASGNAEAALHAAQRLCDTLAELRPPVGKTHAFVHELLGLAAEYARERGSIRLDDFEAAYLNGGKLRSIMSLAGLRRFLSEAALALAGAGTDGYAPDAAKHPFVRKALQYMRDHFRENIGTADIAQYVRLSRSYLSDLFGKETGESLSEALTRIRIEEAKRLLGTGEKKVYEVAEAVGFQDAKTFAKTFKKVVGCSPKEYEAR
nr:response regulator [Paenibacillus hamazuiensis]